MRTGMASWLRAETLTIFGKLHLRRHNYEQAFRCFQKVAQLQPLNASAIAKLGYCYAALGRHRDALDAYDRALQIRPDFTSLYANYSLALNRIGDTKIAAE